MLGSVDKKGAGEFTLPGLFKVSVQKVPAKAKRFGKDPFTGEERWFPAAGFGEGEGSPAQEAEGRRAVFPRSIRSSRKGPPRKRRAFFARRAFA